MTAALSKSVTEETAAIITSPLNRGRLRSSLAAGKPTVGTFVGAASAVTAEVCAAVGADWVLLDLEHGAGGEEQVGPVVLAAGAYGVPTVVRVESAERIRLGRVLDLGAAGVMLPRLDTAAEVAKALRHLRYPPDGDRGVATYNRAASASIQLPSIAPITRSSPSCKSSRPERWSRWRRLQHSTQSMSCSLVRET
jgi:2-keto-3-deoxy-L-rhamnonate aldolase RhmA